MSVELVERLGQVDRTSVDEVLEYLKDGIRRRWAAGNEVVHLDHLMARIHLGGQNGDLSVEWDDGLGTGNRGRGVDVGLRQAVLEFYQVALRRAVLAVGGTSTGSHAQRRTSAVEEKNRRYRDHLKDGNTEG